MVDTPDAPDTLAQVVILSRHGIRAPLMGYGSALANATVNPWPTWETPAGLLTPKGAKVERQLAQYLREQLAETGLLPQGICPKQGDVMVYANSLPRTFETAEQFVQGAFPGCEITVQSHRPIGEMDPTFNPILSLPITENFRQKAHQSIDDLAGPGGVTQLNAQLQPQYAILARILDTPHAPACHQQGQCRWEDQPIEITLEQGKEPSMRGPLRTATGIVDAFLLQYYEGYPPEAVAWGKLTDPAEWRQLEMLKNRYNDLLFAAPAIAPRVSKPLLEFIQAALTEVPSPTPEARQAHEAKLSVLVGHDSNIGALLAALGTAPYTLPFQYEKTPISGKVIFERWHHPRTHAEHIKIEYVYPSTEDLREAAIFSASHPPQRVTLQLTGCPTDTEGRCRLEDFQHVLAQALANTRTSAPRG